MTCFMCMMKSWQIWLCGMPVGICVKGIGKTMRNVFKKTDSACKSGNER